MATKPNAKTGGATCASTSNASQPDKVHALAQSIEDVLNTSINLNFKFKQPNKCPHHAAFYDHLIHMILCADCITISDLPTSWQIPNETYPSPYDGLLTQ